MKLFNFLLIFFLVNSINLLGQNEISEALLDNVVAIKTNFSDNFSKNGFGFVVGEKDGRLFIATAGHVVFDVDNDKFGEVYVRFRKDDKPYKIKKIQKHNEEVDIALIELNEYPKQYRWKKDCMASSVHLNDNLSFIGRDGEWYVSPKNPPGTVYKLENDFIYFDITTIEIGCSGAPLLNEEGLVGIVTEDSGNKSKATSIQKAKEFFNDNGRFPHFFSLVEKKIGFDSITKQKSKLWDGVTLGTVISGFTLVTIGGITAINSSNGDPYKTYRDNLDPDDGIWNQLGYSSRQDLYDKENNRYKLGQWLVIGGVAILISGTIRLIDKGKNNSNDAQGNISLKKFNVNPMFTFTSAPKFSPVAGFSMSIDF